MKTLIVCGVLISTALASPRTVPAFQTGSWTGWITGEKCEPKGPSVKHRDCTLKVAKEGPKLVFWDVKTRSHYPLDDQKAAVLRIGYLVTVTGTLKGGAIAVASIVPAGIGASETMCSALTPETAAAVTSRTYTDTNSQFDNASAKHCEYRGGADVVSVSLVIGANARERFDASAKFPGAKPVTGIGERANWEPVRGTLSVLAGSRALDVRISPSHGAAARRLDLARQIAEIVMGR